MHALLKLPEPADDRTQSAMLRLFYEQSLVSLVATALLVALQCSYAASLVPMVVPMTVLTVWTLAFALLLLQRARWHARAVASSDLTGLLWAAALVMDFRAELPSSQMFAGCWSASPASPAST